jgi:riboflavin kinase/FMN adenylyltransferase
VEILDAIDQLGAVPGPVYLAIGVFDGVHLGHRAVIRRALADAGRGGGSGVAVTFDPHPARILRPGAAPRLITSSPHKARLLADLGVRWLLVIPFNLEFAATPPETFIRSLHAACRPLREICVGHEWSFGRNRSGNLALLQRMGDELGFDEVGVPAFQVAGVVASSTLIREKIERGDLDEVARFLGRAYSILGTVIGGEQLGRQLGYSTANLSAHSEQFPPDGVWVVQARLGHERFGGVANIGCRPTVSGGETKRLLEVHLFDFDRDIYGAELEVFFKRHLRPERKFAHTEELKAQIAADCAAARRLMVS